MLSCVSPRRNTKKREKFDKQKLINIIRKILVYNKNKMEKIMYEKTPKQMLMEFSIWLIKLVIIWLILIGIHNNIILSIKSIF